MSRHERIDAVDGLRAVAMTMVVAQHCGLLPFGWTGVWLFYVISGFVITRGFLGEGDARPFGARYAGFLGRRALRIVPAYALYLAASAAALSITAGPASGDVSKALGDLPYLLTFTHNWHMALEPGATWGPFGHLWTLSVEQQFYLLFPLLVLLVPGRAQVALTWALVAAGPLVRWAWSAWAASQFDGAGARAFAVYAATPCHVDAFLAGSLIARAPAQALAAAAPRLWRAAVLLGFAYAAAYVLVNRRLGAQGADLLRNIVSGVLHGEGREVWVYLVVDAFAAALLVHVLPGGAGARALAWAPVAWVGRVSYGAYLWHLLVLWALSQALGERVPSQPLGLRLALFVVVWAGTLALAGASWRWWEAPLARRWRGRAPAPPAAAVASEGVR